MAPRGILWLVHSVQWTVSCVTAILETSSATDSNAPVEKNYSAWSRPSSLDNAALSAQPQVKLTTLIKHTLKMWQLCVWSINPTFSFMKVDGFLQYPLQDYILGQKKPVHILTPYFPMNTINLLAVYCSISKARTCRQAGLMLHYCNINADTKNL
jgi:hypothetical protein